MIQTASILPDGDGSAAAKSDNKKPRAPAAYPRYSWTLGEPPPSVKQDILV